MAELQKEFSSLNSEMKEIDEIEKKAVARDRFQEYKYKVGTYGYILDPEDKTMDANDEDRENAHVGMSGLVYTSMSANSDYACVMLKEKTDHARAKNVLVKLDAVQKLKDEKVKDKEPFIKILLGETNA
jgi:hypothetical protein